VIVAEGEACEACAESTRRNCCDGCGLNYADEHLRRCESGTYCAACLDAAKERAMNINDLTIGEARKIAQLFGRSDAPASGTDGPWYVGAAVFIRTVTSHFTGQILRVYPGEIVLGSAAWIADTNEGCRFADFLRDGPDAKTEIEPYPEGSEVIISRGAIVDATEWQHPLPRVQQ